MTAQEAKRQAIFWGVGFIIFCLTLRLLNDVLLPFVAGTVIAYLLNPFAQKMVSWGMKRWLASTCALLAFVLAFVALLVIMAPLIMTQVEHLLTNLPQMAQAIEGKITPLVEKIMVHVSAEDIEKIKEAGGSIASSGLSYVAKFIGQIMSGGMAVLDIISLVFITPIVAFYLLRDWDGLVKHIDNLLPRQYANTIRQQISKIDETLAAFLRGQGTVCLFLGLFYGIGLTIVGLDFGIVIGIVAGVLSFIPYVGSIFGFAASTGLALLQFDGYTQVIIVMGIFFAGQLIEGNILTPRLVGGKVGLHPVWVFLALLTGGALFGFVGVLVAMPVAASMGVMVRFITGQYLQSGYYNGPQKAKKKTPAKKGKAKTAKTVKA